MKNEYMGESFLNRLYKDLYNSDEVVHTAINSDTKDERVRKYLERLRKVEELARDSKYNGLELLKKMYYDKYIIKEENIPESYFELQKKIALERGMGHIEITEDMKKQLTKDIINDQKSSLDTWLDYLINDDANYPEWFKYYAFQGMIRLGSYDKATRTFNKRTSSTTNIFVDLNREALALVYDDLCEVLNGKKVDDEVLQKLLVGGSFSKLYSYTLELLDKNNKDISDDTKGIWIKYNKGSEPDELVNSLKGKGTSWCTAGKETARQQLELGDFYVYYTKDSNNEYKQPRIAIRMEGNQIGEIRGINENQHLESEMEEVLEEKLKEFPDRDKYKKKVNDMKKLTDIYNEYKNRELTVEELRFLYEVDKKIEGFGYEEDPRIEEILRGRNVKEDLAKVFNCKPEQISNDVNDVLAGKEIIYFYDDLDLRNLTDAKGLKLPRHVKGDLTLVNLISIEDLVLPEAINGNLNLNGLTRAKGLRFPEIIGDSLFLNNLTSAQNIVFPKEIGGCLHLEKLTYAENLTFPETIDCDLDLSNLTSAKNLILPQDVEGLLDLSNLTYAKDLVLPKTMNGSLDLKNLTKIENLKLPQYVKYSLLLNSLPSAEGLILPETIGVNLNLNGLTSAKGLVLPENIGESLYLGNLTSAIGLVLPKTIGGGSLDLGGLISAKGLTLPKSIRGYLNLENLTDIEGLILPETIGGNLCLNSLSSAKDLTLPQSVGGCLHLEKLTYAENLTFPETIDCDLDLSNLTDAKELKLPQYIKGSLNLSNLTYVKDLVLPKTIKGSLNLRKLAKIENLKLPQSVGGDLRLDSLPSAEGLKLPQSVGGHLCLDSLPSAEGLKLPQSIGGNLELWNLRDAKNIIFPETIGKNLYLYGLKNAEGLIVPQNFSYEYLRSNYITMDDLKRVSENSDIKSK